MREIHPGPVRIVCVHGAGAGGWEWGIWARVFGARGYPVLAPDLAPGEAGLVATRFQDYRDQALAWCCAVPPPRTLIGASLGGLLALSVAEDAGAAALVLVNPMPPAGIAVPAGQPARAAVIRWRGTRTLAGTRRAMPDADDAARAYAFRRWRDESGAVLDAARAGVGIVAPRCPVLILAGEHDTDIPAETSRALADRLGADFELIARASHVGPLLGRSAARSAERVCDWLAGL